MITILYEEEDGAINPITHVHVCVDTLAELQEVIKQHSGAWQSLEGLPFGIDTAKEIIGDQPCNDGIHVVFHAPDAETASKIWDEMF